jgi:hypothetical protein
MDKKQIYKIVVTIATCVTTCLAIALGLSSCTLTRTVTTQSQYYERGDTTCTIISKTVETYDGTRKKY